MSTIIIINVVNIIILAVLTMSYIIMGMPNIFLILFGAWIIYACAINYAILIKSKDKIAALKRADRHRMFERQVNVIIKALQSTEFYRQIFEKYDETSSVREAFDMLAKDADMTADKAIRWMNTYDYHTRPSIEYIVSLSERAATIISKLNELNETLIRIEDSTQSDDMNDVNDLINSLKEILRDE